MAKNQSIVTSLDDAVAPEVVAEERAKPKELKGTGNDVALSGQRRTITIHPTDGDGGSDAVFVSLNGYGYQIPRGEPFSVPVEVIEIIKNARTTVLSSGEGGKVLERTVQRHAFSLE